jgi:hypothetical protein
MKKGRWQWVMGLVRRRRVMVVVREFEHPSELVRGE